MKLSSSQSLRMHLFSSLLTVGLWSSTPLHADPPYPPVALSQPLPLSTPIHGLIDLPGQEDRFTFELHLGQRLMFDAQDDDEEPLIARLLAPDGHPLWEIDAGNDSSPFYPTQPGRHTLVLFGWGGGTGDYHFRLLDLSQADCIEVGATVSGRLDPSTTLQAYQFTASAGQKLRFESVAASSPDASWSLWPAWHQWLASAPLVSPLGELTLPGTGTYWIIVQGLQDGPAPLDYTFTTTLISNPVGVPDGFNALLQGILQPDQAIQFHYTAPAGTIIYLDNLDGEFSWLYTSLRDPEGSVVFSSWGSFDSGPATLLLSGDYTLELSAIHPSAPASYALRLLDLDSTASDLPFGVTVNVPGMPHATASYRFTGSPGQHLYLDFLDTPAGTAEARLVGPSGSTVYHSWGPTSDDRFLLTEPGAHHLFIQDPAGVDHHFRLLDLTAPSPPLLELNSTVGGTLSHGWEDALFQFQGSADQQLFFNAQGSDSRGTWGLITPAGQSLGTYNVLADFPITLPETGIYCIALASESSTPIDYRFTVVTVAPTLAPLPLGSTVLATLLSPGQQLRFSFNGTVGQRLLYESLPTELSNFVSVLTGPDGENLFVLSESDADQAPFTLRLSGVYTLSLGGHTDQTGLYPFRLIDVSAPPVALLQPDQTINGVLDLNGESDFYLINGIAGQRLVIGGLTPSVPVNWTLYAPDDHRYRSGYLDQHAVIELPQTGAHLLALSSTTPFQAAPYSFQLQTLVTTSTPLLLGSLIEGHIESPGAEHRYTFNSTAGTSLYYDALNSNFNGFNLQLFDPYGRLVIDRDTLSDYGPVTLAHSGNYTLLIGGSPQYIGDYRFRLLDLALMPEWPGVVTGQLNPPNETDLYRFNAHAGERLSLELLSLHAGQAQGLVFAPSGELLAGVPMNETPPDLLIPYDGTYFFAVQGLNESPTPLDYEMRSTITPPSGISSGFGTVHSGSIGLAETHLFHYNAPAGTLAYLDCQTPPGSALEIYLSSDTGDFTYQDHLDADSGPWRLPHSGAYLLAVRGQTPAATGAYRFRLLDLATGATTVEMGSTTYATLDNPFETRIYQFPSSIGQQLYYDALTAQTSVEVSFTSFSSTGALFLPGAGSPYEDQGPVILTAPGTCYLVFQSQQAAPANLAFRLLDLEQPDVPAIIPGDLITATLDPGTFTHVYRLLLHSPTNAFFRGSGSNSSAHWQLYAPNLDWVSGGNVVGDVAINFPYPDEPYLLLLKGHTVAPVPYTFEFRYSTSLISDLPLNTSVSGNLGSAGGKRLFTFSGLGGQAFYYDALDADFDSVQVTLHGPRGQLPFGGNADFDFGPFLLLESGTYTLVLESQQFDETDFSFRLIEASNQPLVAFDTPIHDTFDAAYQAHLYRLVPTAGLPLFFEGLVPPTSSTSWSFHCPSGGYLVGNPVNSPLRIIPSFSGTYWLVLNHNDLEVTPYTFQVIPGNHAPILHPINNATVDEDVLFAFTASADDRELPNDQLTFALGPGAPDGASIDPRSGLFRWTPAENHGPGEYAITVHVADDGIPSLSDALTFLVQVREVNRTPALTLGHQTIHAGGTLQLPLPASDPDLPPNVLTLSLTAGPPGAILDPLNTRLTWTSTIADTGLTYPVNLEVADDGIPPLSITSTFTVSIVPPLHLDSLEFGQSSVTLFWWGIDGHHYRVDFRDDLLSSAWSSLPGTVQASGTLTAATDSALPFPHERYYRVSDLGPIP